MKVETSSLKWFASFSPMVRFGFRPTAESELRHWPNVTRDVVFLHRPGACTTGFLEEFDGNRGLQDRGPPLAERAR